MRRTSLPSWPERGIERTLENVISLVSPLLALLLVVGLGHGDCGLGHPALRRDAGSPNGSLFTKEIRPMLERRCRPCHFSGGTMYGKLPFDRPETIVKLGTRLFTRIKDETERAKIRQFLAEHPVASAVSTGPRR